MVLLTVFPMQMISFRLCGTVIKKRISVKEECGLKNADDSRKSKNSRSRRRNRASQGVSLRPLYVVTLNWRRED
jgi:hypothetical protein